MKSVRCGFRKYYYKKEHLDIRTLPPITKEDAKTTLFAMQDLLKAKGIDIYLTYGTLLGAVREKDFISGDLDVDCYIIDRKAIFNNLAYLEAHGMKLIRAGSAVFSFRYEALQGCYIDLYVRRIPFNIWALYCYQHSLSMCPRKLLQDGEIDFLGRTFKCPQNPEQVLRFWYGDTWRHPIAKSQKNYKYTVASHYYYLMVKNNLFKGIKYGIQYLIGWYHWRHLVRKEYRNENSTKK